MIGWHLTAAIKLPGQIVCNVPRKQVCISVCTGVHIADHTGDGIGFCPDSRDDKNLTTAVVGHRTHPRVFDPLTTAMVASGETAGQLGPVLERRADDLEAADAIRRKILGATVYPVLLLAIALIVTVILLVFVVPEVANQFVVLGEELPPAPAPGDSFT